MPKHTLLEGVIARCCTGGAHLNFYVLLLGQPPTPMIKCSVGSKTFEPACISWDTPCIAEGPQVSEHVSWEIMVAIIGSLEHVVLFCGTTDI